jgi:hypothetical protein
MAVAAPGSHPQPAAPAQSAVGDPAPAAALSDDPYVAQSSFGTQAPMPMTSCSVYAYQCVYDNGPCGPNHACACQFRPGTGFVCAKVGL